MKFLQAAHKRMFTIPLGNTWYHPTLSCTHINFTCNTTLQVGCTLARSGNDSSLDAGVPAWRAGADAVGPGRAAPSTGSPLKLLPNACVCASQANTLQSAHGTVLSSLTQPSLYLFCRDLTGMGGMPVAVSPRVQSIRPPSTPTESTMAKPSSQEECGKVMVHSILGAPRLMPPP